MLELAELPAPDTELVYEGKAVGRITSAARDGGRVVALAYVRREVPEGASLQLAVVVRPARFELATSASAGQRSIP